MRKLLACFLIFTAMFMCSSKREKLIFNGVDGVYTFYLNSASSNAEMVTVTTNEAESIKSKLKNIEGESITFSAENDYEKKWINKYKAVEVMRETVNFTTNVYYYSDKIASFVYIKAKKINLHVSYGGEYKSVGIPFIFGSY